MPVDVLGGALTFEASVDTTKLEDQLAAGIQNGTEQVKKFNAELAKSASGTSAAFSSKTVNSFFASIKAASDKITPLLQKGLAGLDPTLLKQLEGQVGSTVDEFQKLRIVTDFIKKNINSFKLNPDELAQLSESVDAVQKSFDGVAGKEQTVFNRLRLIKAELAALVANGVDKTDPVFQAKLEEATELEHALKNVNKQLNLSAGEVPGLVALQQGFRGLLGGVEAAVGVMGLFTDDQKQAEEITKNLVAIMAILNGAEELGAVLTKKSALNEFLLAKFRTSTAEATAEAAVAEVANTTAQEAGVAATEGATAAQLGLNAALLANPVIAIIGGIVALYGAYKILEATLFQTTLAEREQKAEIESLADAQQKAADSIASEEVSMISLIKTAQNKNLADRRRAEAIDELRLKYPEYLSGLSREAILTGQASNAIQIQLNLLKKKAEAAAAEDILKEKIKEQIEAQAKLSKLTEEFERNFGKGRLESFLKTGSAMDIQDAMDKVEEKTAEVNGTLKTFGALQEKVQVEVGATGVSVDGLVDHIQSLAKLGGDDHMFDGIITGIKKLGHFFDDLKPFDPKEFDKEKEQILSQYQFRVDTAKKGTGQELQLRKALLLKEQDLLNEQVRKKDARVVTLDGDLTPTGLAEKARILSDLQSVSEQATESFLKNIADLADSIVIDMTRAGQAGSAAYFNAQREAIKAGAAEEIKQANDNAGTIKKIRAQLALDLHNIDLEQQRQQIEDDKSILQIRLNLAKEGSFEELSIRKQIIRDSAEEEVLAAGANQVKINEIRAKAAKEQADLDEKFLLELQQTELNVALAGIETRLAAVRQGSEEELRLKKQEVVAKAELDIRNAELQIKNQELLQATIQKIEAESLRERRKLEDAFFKESLQKNLDVIQEQADFANTRLQKTIDDPNVSLRTKQKAQEKQDANSIEAIRKQMQAVDADIVRGRGDIDDLVKQYNELVRKLEKLKNDSNNTILKNIDERLKASQANIARLGDIFDGLSSSVGDLNPGLSRTFKELGNIASAASNGIATFAGLKKGLEDFKKASIKNDEGKADVSGQLTAAVDIATLIATQVQKIVEGFKAISDSKKKAEQDVLDFQTKILIGEEQYNEIIRERARQQVLLNKLTLQGLQDQKNLLEQQKRTVDNSFNDIFAKLQQESFVASEGTKTKKTFFGSFLSGLTQGWVGALKGSEREVSKTLQSLSGKSFDEIEKLFNQGQLTDKAKELFLQLQKIKQEGVDIDALLAENAQKFKEALTGTTAESITQSIVDGFAAGKREAGDFADTFQDLMKGAMLAALKLKFLEGPLKDFFDQFASLTDSGDQLDSSEIAQLKTMFNTIITNASSQFDALQQIAGINIASQTSQGNSLTGAIKGITEQQAELLAGQFGGLRLTALDQLNIARQSLLVQQDIELNTGLAAARLLILCDKFDRYETGQRTLHVQF